MLCPCTGSAGRGHAPRGARQCKMGPAALRRGEELRAPTAQRGQDPHRPVLSHTMFLDDNFLVTFIIS